MDSIVLYTEEIDNLREATEDLFAQAENFTLKKNTLGVLFAEEETDYPALYALLASRWKFPVIGCTTLAMLLAEQGVARTGISVLLLSADDCEFAVGMTADTVEVHGVGLDTGRLIGDGLGPGAVHADGAVDLRMAV